VSERIQVTEPDFDVSRELERRHLGSSLKGRS
jgi:hypothetical protein